MFNKLVLLAILVLGSIGLCYADTDRDIDEVIVSHPSIHDSQKDIFYSIATSSGINWKYWIIVSSGTKNQGIEVKNESIRSKITDGNFIDITGQITFTER